MQRLLARFGAFYAKNTFVRHAVTALTAVTVVESSPVLTDWATTWFDTHVVRTVAIGAIGAATRWAQTQLELLIVRLKSAP